MAQSTEFVDGWNTLPDELKLAVLGYALPVNKAFGQRDFNKNLAQSTLESPLFSRPYYEQQKKRFIKRFKRFDIAILPLLACPAISSLAYETFYKQNAMRLSANLPTLPPRPARIFIRYLELNVVASVERVRSFVKLAEASHLFPNLSSLSIDIFGCFSDFALGGSQSEVAAAIAEQPSICFKTKRLITTYRHHRRILGGQLSRDKMETLFLSAMSVVTDGRAPKDRWERWTEVSSDSGKVRNYCDAWPESEVYQGGNRWTERTVWA